MKNWYVVHCYSGREDKAREGLDDQHYKVILPEIYTDKRAAKKKDIEIMYPGYLFIQLELGKDSIGPIKYTRGVLRIVQFGDYMPVVGDDFINEILSRKDIDGIIHAYRDYQKGDPIRLAGGAYEGHLGKIAETPKDQRGWLLIEILGKQYKAKRENVRPAA